MLTAEQQLLVENNLKLAYHRANKWYNKLTELGENVELSECISICMESLCKAAASWEQDGGGSFANYAITSMNNTFHVRWKEQGRLKRKSGVMLSLDEPLAHSFGDVEFTLLDVVDRPHSEDIILWNAQIQHVFQHLDEMEIKVLTMYYLYNWSYRRIGEELGVSYQSVQQKLTRTIKKCQKILVINE